MLNIFEFINYRFYNIKLGNWFTDIWYPLFEQKNVLITNDILHLINNGITGSMAIDPEKMKKYKGNLIVILKNYNIEYTEIKYDSPLALEYEYIQTEIKNLQPNNLVQKKWILLSVRNFKSLIMRLNTKIAHEIREYYITLEEIFYDYSKYVSEYNIKLEKAKFIKAEQEKEKLALEYQSEINQIKSKNEELEKFNMKLKTMMTNLKLKEPAQIIYVATSQIYAKNNRFKIGGVKSIELLKGRLNTYNSGRSIEDKYYYCHIAYCFDYRQVESRIEKCIGEFREVQEAELYNVHYNAAIEIVNFISERFSEEVEKYKSIFEEILRDTLTKEPIVPDPLIINGAEYRSFRNGKEINTQKIDWDLMEENQKKDFVRNIFNEYLESLVDSNIELQRKEFEIFLERQHQVKFNKKKMWPLLKLVAKDKEKKVKY